MVTKTGEIYRSSGRASNYTPPQFKYSIRRSASGIREDRKEAMAKRREALYSYRKQWDKAYKTYTDEESVLSSNIRKIQRQRIPHSRSLFSNLGRTQRARYFAQVKQERIKQAAPYARAGAAVRVAKARFLKQYPKR